MLLLGTYADANANGLMGDSVHPNTLANKMIASYIGSYLGFPGNAPTQDPDAYEGVGTSQNFEYSGELPSVATGLVAQGNNAILYNIGLINGYPHAVFEFEVTAGKNGSFESVRTRWIMQFANTTVNNRVTSIAATVAELEEYRNDGGVAHTHTVSATIVNNKAQVIITSDNLAQNYTVTGNWRFAYLGTKGQSVYVD